MLFRSTAVLFGDGDQDERRMLWVNSIQIRAGKLSDAELEALGSPTAAGIPIALGIEQPVLNVTRNANGSITIAWQAETAFTLETKPSLTTDTWTPVPDVVNDSVTLTPNQPAAFYRLRR